MWEIIAFSLSLPFRCRLCARWLCDKTPYSKRIKQITFNKTPSDKNTFSQKAFKIKCRQNTCGQGGEGKGGYLFLSTAPSPPWGILPIFQSYPPPWACPKLENFIFFYKKRTVITKKILIFLNNLNIVLLMVSFAIFEPFFTLPYPLTPWKIIFVLLPGTFFTTPLIGATRQLCSGVPLTYNPTQLSTHPDGILC